MGPRDPAFTPEYDLWWTGSTAHALQAEKKSAATKYLEATHEENTSEDVV